jgi:hypothetical protein
MTACSFGVPQEYSHKITVHKSPHNFDKLTTSKGMSQLTNFPYVNSRIITTTMVLENHYLTSGKLQGLVTTGSPFLFWGGVSYHFFDRFALLRDEYGQGMVSECLGHFP